MFTDSGNTGKTQICATLALDCSLLLLYWDFFIYGIYMKKCHYEENTYNYTYTHTQALKCVSQVQCSCSAASWSEPWTTGPPESPSSHQLLLLTGLFNHFLPPFPWQSPLTLPLLGFFPLDCFPNFPSTDPLYTHCDRLLSSRPPPPPPKPPSPPPPFSLPSHLTAIRAHADSRISPAVGNWLWGPACIVSLALHGKKQEKKKYQRVRLGVARKPASGGLHMLQRH